jgi:hypothetical protein
MSNVNLTLHCGAHHVEREQLFLAETPQPTETWNPIPHWQLVDEIERALSVSGYQVIGQEHAMARGNNRYFGLFEIINGNNHDDYHTIVGLRNSHDKSFPAGLAVGSGVFVCDNLCFSGEIQIGRRHTTHINRDLPGLIDAAIGRLNTMRTSQDARISAYKQTEFNQDLSDHLLIELLRARVVTATKIPKILKSYENPEHPEFSKDGHTAWRFFNSVTEHLKGGLADLPRVGQALHGILDGQCGVTIDHTTGQVAA